MSDSGNTQGQRDLQRNFFSLENIFPYSLHVLISSSV
jgi:hypothetical protein